MPRKKGKSISFDVMVKFFLQHYNIPTRKDIDKLNTRLDKIERLIIGAASSRNFRIRGRKGQKSATDTVIDVIMEANDGLPFAEIRERTGYEDKKLRNIIFRLNKRGKIKRKSRGIYISA